MDRGKFRTVAKVKPGHRIDGLTVPALFLQKVACSQCEHARLGRLEIFALQHIRTASLGQRDGGGDILIGHLLALDPASKARHGRERDKGLEPGQHRLQIACHLLDQERAEGDARQPRLTVRDGIEHGDTRLIGQHGITIGRQNTLDRARDFLGQRDLDKDQWLVRDRRVEIGKASAIRRLDPAAQLVPAVDLMHRLVGNDLLQNGGRRGPVDRPQHKEPAIEPRAQEMLKVLIDPRQRRVFGQKFEKPRPHVDQRSGAARGHVQAAQQFLTRRLGSRQKAGDRLGCLVLGIGFGGTRNPFGIGIVGFSQMGEEGELIFRREMAGTRENVGGEGNARGLPPRGHEIGAKLDQRPVIGNAA